IEICDYLTTRHALLALARTCTVFKDPSLNRVWSGYLDPIKISDILSALPDSVKENAYGDVVDFIPTQEGWQRLYSYAKRVRYLSFDYRFRVCQPSTHILRCRRLSKGYSAILYRVHFLWASSTQHGSHGQRRE
ncbi:hypothetical protein CONPUDRAFT_143398, partial [Coniophora puteana RWD-64-598 SS2]